MIIWKYKKFNKRGECDEAHIHYQWHLKCTVEIWKKYLFIAAYGLITASLGKTLGEVYEDEQIRQTTLEVIREIARVGRKEGIEIPVIKKLYAML